MIRVSPSFVAASIAEPPEETGAVPPDALNAYPRALVESSLEKVLASTVFRRSERHRQLMRYVVQAALDGRRDRLKEVLLGIALFDRKLDRYDPRSDPIVRVEVGRVREKLARYYEREGVADVFAFAIPVGSYVPRFDRRLRPTEPARPIESFAVMPFATGSADEDQAFAIGLADQLINLLGRVRDLKVVARVSAFKARERKLEVRDIGKLLQVTRVVDGSVQRQGDRLRCIAHVYRVKDGMRLWSQSFDSQLFAAESGLEGDLFAFQDHIAEHVLAAVAPVAVAPADRPAPVVEAGAPTADRRRSRDLFERGSYLRRRYDAAISGKVIDLFEEAVALDRDSTRAHHALAVAYVDEVALLNVPTLALLPKIEATAERALALDPMDGDALSLRASIAFRFDFDWEKAERLFIDALRIAPYAVTVNYRYASGLIFDGRFADGFRHLGFAIELDPLNLGLRASRVHLLAYARDYRQAEKEAQVILELEPSHLYTHIVLALIYLYQRQSETAMPHLDAVIAALPDHPAAHFVRICAWGLQGDVERGNAALDGLLARLGDRYSSPFSRAMALACLGRRDEACAALERAAVERDPLFCSLPVDPLFAVFHQDPAFIALLARHGLRSPVS